MKKLILITLSIFMLTGCGVKGYHTIEPNDALDLIETNDAVIIDVRSANEYVDGHIDGSILLPVNVIEGVIKNVVADLDQKILIYCATGARSKEAALILIELGYQEVYDLGGIESYDYNLIK